MKIFFLFSLINGLTATFFGLLIFFKNRKSLQNKTFLLTNIGVAIWSFSYCAWLLMGNEKSALFWSRALNFGATLIPIFYLHWILVFLNLTERNKKIIIFGYTTTIIFTLLSFSAYYIESVKPILFFSYWPQAGPLYVCFLVLNYFGLLGYALFLLLRARKTVLGEKKNQIDYIILATIIGFGGGATNFPLMFGVSLLPPIGQPLVALYILILIFAILRYHLFDIKVIFTEILVGAIVLLLAVQFFLSQSTFEYIWKGALFLLFAIFGYLLIRSVMQEIKYREQLQYAYQELQKLDEAKSEFVSIASHQLRTPLTAIKGYISLLLDGSYGELTDKNRPPIENVYKSSERLIKLINELLSISRIEAGKMEMNFERASLEEIIDSVFEELKLQAKEKRLYLKKEKSKTPVPELFIDKDKIKQVIMNVVDNAIKYTNKGGIVIKTEIKNSKALIEVSDTGEGMNKEEIAKLFKSFSRGSAGNELSVNGAGLGLHIARRFVEIQGGRIWAESAGKGKGSTLFIELPIKTEKE